MVKKSNIITIVCVYTVVATAMVGVGALIDRQIKKRSIAKATKQVQVLIECVNKSILIPVEEKPAVLVDLRRAMNAINDFATSKSVDAEITNLDINRNIKAAQSKVAKYGVQLG